MPTVELSTDVALGVAIPSRNARGRIARLGHVVDSVLANHRYPPVIERLLAEALVLTALLGALLKEPGGQITLQAQTEAGAIDLLVCDYLAGQLRGYIRHDPERLADAGPNPSLFALFGKGYLAITFDHPTINERYQGIVPLEGESLAQAAQSFFAQSEQIPSIVRLAAEKRDGHWMAGGLLFQHLPEGVLGRERLHTRLDQPEWQHVEALGSTMGADELADAAIPLENLVWRLFNEESEVRLLSGAQLSRGCRCDSAYITQVLGKFPAEERAAMADENGVISVDCAFCSTKVPVQLGDFVSPPL